MFPAFLSVFLGYLLVEPTSIVGKVGKCVVNFKVESMVFPQQDNSFEISI